MQKLVFIGAGSMAEAMISGILENKLMASTHIWVTNKKNKERLSHLNHQYGVQASYDLNVLFDGADVVVLAMKPKNAAEAIKEIRPFLSDESLLISVLAGISIPTIEALSGKRLAIARAMPNTSAAIGKSATAIAVNHAVTDPQMATIKQLFETVGFVVNVAEEQLDAVTGLSGSGPAYIYYLVEAMEKGAVEIGLDPEVARKLIVQTFIGAAEMVSVSQKSSKQLRKDVTSPGGTTEVGIQILEENRVQQVFVECIKAATAQSKKMGHALKAELNL